MSSSFSLFTMSSFPSMSMDETMYAPKQLPLLLSNHIPKTLPRTEFKLVRRIDHLNVDVYDCLHEHVVEEIGRIDEMDFTSYIKKDNFLSYYSRDINLFMMNVSKDVASGSFSKMTGEMRFKGRRKSINLREIENQVEKLTGMYASVEGSVSVQSQALFGRHINNDPMYERAIREGDMYYVTFDHILQTNSMLQNTQMKFGVGKDSTFVLLQENIPESLSIEVILHVNENLLRHASY